ncbi:MAG: hypothetical protein R2718_05015 [Solirubrobacterales bacterium]|nr:hypothetical protein [Solirubrobacterales bacterium]
MQLRRAQVLLASLLVLLAVGALAASAPGKMRTKKLGAGLCRTTGGGKFVPIPGFPGERIDRRLLPDIKYLVRRYKIFITDGYSNDPVHAANGEHPIGLALDIVPDKANGGSWKLVSRLAKRAEPVQNQPVAPWRWVGYNGDAGHGRGHHLHLSWNHSDARPGHPAKTVYTMRCPGSAAGAGGAGKDGGSGGGGKGGGNAGPGGGLQPGKGGGGGGIRPRAASGFERDAADPVAETGGVGL